MKVDMRVHSNIRAQVHAGLVALRIQSRQVRGESNEKRPCWSMVGETDPTALKRKLGTILFDAVRWIDNYGFDVLECLDLAIEHAEGPKQEIPEW